MTSMQQRDLPRVCFIIPAYNAARTLSVTADSLIAQTIAEWEAIIIDDGSRDRTAQIAGKVVAADPRFRLIQQENRGVSAARNVGIREARADRVVFIDADDWIAPDYLETLLPLAQEPHDLPFCAYRRIFPSGTNTPSAYCAQLMTEPLEVLTGLCEPAIHCVIVPRDLVLDIGAFDEELRWGEDWDLWLRFARVGARFVGTPRDLAFYRMHAGTLSSNADYGDKIVKVMEQRIRSRDERLPEWAPYRDKIELPSSALADRQRTLLFAELDRFCRDGTVSAQWYEGDPAGWAEASLTDPEDFAHLVLTEYAKERAPLPTPDVAEKLLAALEDIDPESTARFRDGLHLHHAKLHDGVFGRYMSASLDLASLPETIMPPEGVDSFVGRLVDNPTDQRLITLVFDGPISRKDLLEEIVPAIPLGRLVRGTRVYHSPRFWLTAACVLLGQSFGRRRSEARDRRKTLGSAIRAGAVVSLGVDAWPNWRKQDIVVPLIAFRKVLVEDARYCKTEIGVRQLRTLIDLLEAEGYRSVTLEQISRWREQNEMSFLPMGMIFTDFESVRSSSVWESLPASVMSADILLSPEEVDAVAKNGARLPAEVAERVRFGLTIEDWPEDHAAAYQRACDLFARLRHINGDDGTIAAMSRHHQFDDAILRRAGFFPLLVPGQVSLRLPSFGRSFPVMECNGAEGVGSIVENLRTA